MLEKLYVLFAAVAIVLVSCNDHANQPGRPQADRRDVRVATAQRVAESSHEEFMGTVVARNRAGIESKIPARVERIPVTLGSTVRAGDLLAQLDVREHQARVEQAEAIYRQTAGDLARFNALLAERAVAQQEFDAVKARNSVAEASLSEARTYLSYARIEAPFDGNVTEKLIDVGDLAVPGRPLFTLEESGHLRFEATLPESKMGQVSVGDSAIVVILSMGVEVKGRVIELSPSTDPVSRTFTVKVALPVLATIRPGQFGRLQLSAGGDETIFIPRKALVRRGQLDLVYVVGDDQRAMLRLVRIGRQFSDRLEILAGLRENERVVVEGQRDLSDGDSVRMIP
jgi:RND family efflux transporter MFP subunit